MKLATKGFLLAGVGAVTVATGMGLIRGDVVIALEILSVGAGALAVCIGLSVGFVETLMPRKVKK